MEKYDNIQDYLAAHSYTWNKDSECYEKPSYMSEPRKIPWAETKGYTADSFPAKARARGWVPEDGKVAALADAKIATLSVTRITANSLTVSAPRPLDLKKMFSDEGMRARESAYLEKHLWVTELRVHGPRPHPFGVEHGKLTKPAEVALLRVNLEEEERFAGFMQVMMRKPPVRLSPTLTRAFPQIIRRMRPDKPTEHALDAFCDMASFGDPWTGIEAEPPSSPESDSDK